MKRRCCVPSRGGTVLRVQRCATNSVVSNEEKSMYVSSKTSPHGQMEQTYLVSGKKVSMRIWQNEKPQMKPATRRDYETVGYVLAGQAELVVEGQTITLE